MSDADIPVSDDFQPAPGVEYEDNVEQPAEPVKEEAKAPEPTEKPAEATAEEPKAEPEKEQPRNPETGKFTRKAGPIADLLEKKHSAEERAAQAEARAAELEARIATLSEQPRSTDSAPQIKQIAEAYGVDEELLQHIVNVTRDSVNPDLPSEVKELLAEREQQKAIEAETQVFETRVQKLSTVFKDEPILEHKDKLMKLAYSTELAPDGEPYHEKELSELYFAFIKPEIEPGKSSAEPSRGGTQTTTVLDFEEIAQRDDPRDIEAMDDETFKKYNTWLAEKQGKAPIRRT